MSVVAFMVVVFFSALEYDGFGEPDDDCGSEILVEVGGKVFGIEFIDDDIFKLRLVKKYRKVNICFWIQDPIQYSFYTTHRSE